MRRSTSFSPEVRERAVRMVRGTTAGTYTMHHVTHHRYNMHLKTRGTRTLLYRSKWIPKGSNGNTHGYSVQTFVASLPTDTQQLPDEVATLLSPEELTFVETRLLNPARLAAEQKACALALHAVDPLWRLDEAARLTKEAAKLSLRAAVPNNRVTAIQTELAQVRTISPAPVAPEPRAPVPSHHGDPLQEALHAIKAARDAVLAGRYGSAPAEGVRTTAVYRLWSDIFDTVTGSNDSSLMRALQTRGFAKTRGK